MADQTNTGRNEQRLDHVQRGQAITAEAWNKIVDRLNTPQDVSIKRTRRVKSSDGVEIRLAQLTTGFSWDSTASIYKATARYYDNGRPDTSGNTFELYAPAVTASATASRLTTGTRVWIIARNDRWELLEINDPYQVQYGAGQGITFDAYNDVNYIRNAGLRGAIVQKADGSAAGAYTDQNGNIQFDGLYMKWGSNYTDTVGKFNLTLKTKQVTVVTGINNGTPTTATITVLDPSAN